VNAGAICSIPTRRPRSPKSNGLPVRCLLNDLWEYLNRYTYLPRLKNQAVLVKAIQAAVSGMLPGPFKYAERWDENGQKYLGLLIEKAANPHIVIDRDSVIIKPDVTEAHRPAPAAEMMEGARTDSRSDVMPLDAAILAPAQDRYTGQFRSIVIEDGQWTGSAPPQVGRHTEDQNPFRGMDMEGTKSVTEIPT